MVDAKTTQAAVYIRCHCNGLVLDGFRLADDTPGSAPHFPEMTTQMYRI
jgi:hypothetical protein